MRISNISISLLLLFALRAAPATERWELEIIGPVTIDHGELRFDGAAGRVVMESADSLFVPLLHLARTDSSIAFTIPTGERRFVGYVLGREMRGTMTDADGSTFHWNAERIPPGQDRWPVPPRLTVRQLETGSDIAQVVVPGAWRALLPDTTRLAVEFDTIAKLAGFGSWRGAQLVSRGEQIQLGLDRTVHESAKRALEAIATTETARQKGFMQLFSGPRGWRVDLHDMAIETVVRNHPEFQLGQAMVPIWKLAPVGNPPLDSAAVLEVAWRFWTRYRSDSLFARRLDSLELEDPRGVADARVLIRAYDFASNWWLDATRWLMKERWIHTDEGYRSPSDLVAVFWGDSTLTLPVVRTHHFGVAQAVPLPSVKPILRRLVLPANAVAADWLAQGDLDEVMDAWRTLDWGEPFRTVIGGHSRYLTSPAVELRSHGGDLLETWDLIRIEPGIPPILAVATVVHEWQHLILTGRRLKGTAPGVRENADEIRLLEEDPWLAEGAAEWATDLILAPTRTQAPLLLAISQARRLAIQGRSPDDPHALGYRLIRAAARRASNPRIVTARLTTFLHDLPGFAHASGLSARSPVAPLKLARPVNAAVIPEVTFIYDGGAALDVHRRFRVSLSSLEH